MEAPDEPEELVLGAEVGWAPGPEESRRLAVASTAFGESSTVAIMNPLA